jgi:hypothetical protein
MADSIERQMLQSIASFLERQVKPQLATPSLAPKVMMSSFLLRLLAAWEEEKGQELPEENESMKQVLRRVSGMLKKEKSLSQNQVRNALIERLDRELEVEIVAPGLSEQNRRLKATLVETIEGLDVLADALPGEGMSSLRQQIRSAIRMQLNHNLARIRSLS